MPLYNFELTDGGSVLPDPEGAAWPDIIAARKGALVALGEILSEAVTRGAGVTEMRIDIVDGNGARLSTVKVNCEVTVSSPATRPVSGGAGKRR